MTPRLGWAAVRTPPMPYPSSNWLRLMRNEVTICPWWDGPSTRDEVGAQLGREARRDKKRWI